MPTSLALASALATAPCRPVATPWYPRRGSRAAALPRADRQQGRGEQHGDGRGQIHRQVSAGLSELSPASPSRTPGGSGSDRRPRQSPPGRGPAPLTIRRARPTRSACRSGSPGRSRSACSIRGGPGPRRTDSPRRANAPARRRSAPRRPRAAAAPASRPWARGRGRRRPPDRHRAEQIGRRRGHPRPRHQRTRTAPCARSASTMRPSRLVEARSLTSRIAARSSGPSSRTAIATSAIGPSYPDCQC